MDFPILDISQRESNNISSFVTGFFLSELYFQDSYMLQRVSVLFLLLFNNILLYGYATFLFIHLSDNGNLDCFHFLALMHNASMNVCVQILCGHMFSVLFHMYVGVELLGDMITLCLIFWGSIKLLFKIAALFYTSTSNVWGFHFSLHPKQHL